MTICPLEKDRSDDFMSQYPCERISVVDCMGVFVCVGKILASIKERCIIYIISGQEGKDCENKALF